MLEVRNLKKIYTTKTGLKFQALNSISLKFEEKGMVFILGKSGSGKSTLLNVLGGLDKYDGGEIIIKGKSSKEFKNRDFDSYRNTYLGFIFQEFYIIEDFTVEQNIALALKLQHKKADSNSVNHILRQVDLEGYGERKPNELSGGQKQRVAIARALIKNPDIIMADEPTGSLDSVTGRQMFETLKKLSKDKLVLVVSHDRESAEKYGDRIIELSDGNVINDIKKVKSGHDSSFVSTQNYTYLKESYLHIKKGKELTKSDLEEINNMLLSAEGEVFISLDEKIAQDLHQRAQKHYNGGQATKFIETDKAENDYKTYGNDDFKLIKSKLPFKEAFKIGASGLKRKRIRLAFTILLSVIAFMFFGISDAVASYNRADTLYNALLKTGYKRVGISAYELIINEYGYENKNPVNFTADRLSDFEKFDYEFDSLYKYFYANDLINNLVSYENNNFYYQRFDPLGILETDNFENKGYDIIGKKPSDINDIIITEYLAKFIVKFGLKNASINSYADILDKTINICDTDLKITGIYDMGLEKYKRLEEIKNFENAEDSKLIDLFYRTIKQQEMIYAKKGFIASLSEKADKITNFPLYNYNFWGETKNTGFMPVLVNADTVNIDENNNGGDYYFKLNDGKNIKSLSDNECVMEIYYPIAAESFISANADYDFYDDIQLTNKITAFLDTYFYSDNINLINPNARDNAEKILNIVGISCNIGIFKECLKSNYNNEGYINIYVNNNIIKDYYFSCLRFSTPENLYFTLSGNSLKDLNLLHFITENTYHDITPISGDLDFVDVLADVLKSVFFYASLIFCVFAALLLMNFISISVSYKKKEIGILRALGSRQVDVFSIFTLEGLLIAAIELVIAIAGAVGVIIFLNNLVSKELFNLIRLETDFTLFFFSARQLLLMVAMAVGVVMLASFIPVKKIASMKPIDAIKDK